MNDVFIHDRGICESVKVGPRTRIWAFAHVLPGAVIGKECNICDGVFIENDVVIGDRVTVKCGVQIWDGITIEDDVFVGPNVAFTNDPFPRSKKYPEKFSRTIVRAGASIGANATILPGLEIGANAMVGAGAVVTMSVPPNAVVYGNPARIARYVETEKIGGEPHADAGAVASLSKSPVKGVLYGALPSVLDMRGNLTAIEFEKILPFIPKRCFYIYDVPSEEIRGQHAHRQCEQFLICVCGSCSVVVDDGKKRAEYTLDRPGKGVYIPPMVWGIQYKYSKNAVLMVFASHNYDRSDYLRSFGEWQKLRKEMDGNT
jgi:UDP-2-acetamido-3-amino-2,3-dideoxy-glucuronate N-acetyltransferase